LLREHQALSEISLYLNYVFKWGDAIKSLNEQKKNILNLIAHGLAAQDILTMVLGNPNYSNRLVKLFITLKRLAYGLNDNDYLCLKDNVKLSAQLEELLTFLSEKGVDVKAFSLQQLVKAAGNYDHFKFGVLQLPSKDLTEDVLRLMMTFPIYATELAAVVTKLQEKGASLKDIESTLTRFQEKNIYMACNILLLALEGNVYSPRLSSLLLAQETHLDVIYQGAQKLAEEHLLMENYFAGIQEHANNANLNAKIMILLYHANLWTHFGLKDIKTLNPLGRTAFFLLDQLSNSQMLDKNSYQLILNCHDLLKNPRLLNAVRAVRLFENFTAKDLAAIIKLLEVYRKDTSHKYTEHVLSELETIFSGYSFGPPGGHLGLKM